MYYLRSDYAGELLGLIENGAELYNVTSHKYVCGYGKKFIAVYSGITRKMAYDISCAATNSNECWSRFIEQKPKYYFGTEALEWFDEHLNGKWLSVTDFSRWYNKEDITVLVNDIEWDLSDYDDSQPLPRLPKSVVKTFTFIDNEDKFCQKIDNWLAKKFGFQTSLFAYNILESDEGASRDGEIIYDESLNEEMLDDAYENMFDSFDELDDSFLEDVIPDSEMEELVRFSEFCESEALNNEG